MYENSALESFVLFYRGTVVW